MIVNNPDVAADMETQFACYERATMAHDLAKPGALFHDGSMTGRCANGWKSVSAHVSIEGYVA